MLDLAFVPAFVRRSKPDLVLHFRSLYFTNLPRNPDAPLMSTMTLPAVAAGGATKDHTLLDDSWLVVPQSDLFELYAQLRDGNPHPPFLGQDALAVMDNGNAVHFGVLNLTAWSGTNVGITWKPPPGFSVGYDNTTTAPPSSGRPVPTGADDGEGWHCIWTLDFHVTPCNHACRVQTCKPIMHTCINQTLVHRHACAPSCR